MAKKAYQTTKISRSLSVAKRAEMRVVRDVIKRTTQHNSGIPVNKSVYNGRNGRQSVASEIGQAKTDPGAVRVIPIGGLAEKGIGNNMTAIEYGDEIIIIDMGSIFPSGNDYPGVSLMTPDIGYLEANKHRIKGILFTHAHLDHIGACKFLLPRLPAPVYGTKFTLEMIKRQMTEAEDTDYRPDYVAIDPFVHQRFKLGENFEIEFVHVLHSIPGCVAIVVRTPSGVIVHMGDWRFENDPIKQGFDMPRLLEISQTEGIALMLNESTNIGTPGTHPHSEFAIGESIGTIFEDHMQGRVIVSCFSSQLYRVQILLEAAQRSGRKVALAGYSMINTVEVALRSGELQVPRNLIIRMDQAVKLPDNQVVIICTGSQGESNAVLNRMATGAHPQIKIKSTDCVVFSSNAIPGNEPQVSATVAGMIREGATVIQHGKVHIHGAGPVYLSGHAYYDDHVKLVTTLKPRAYMPIHGEFQMLHYNAEMADKVVGMPRERILVVDDGDIVQLHKDGDVSVAGRVKTGSILRDNQGRVINEAVIRDRLHISSEGIFTVIATISRQTGMLLKTPDVISRACVYLRDNEGLISSINAYVRKQFAGKQRVDESLKNRLRDGVGSIVYESSGNSPVVLVVVNEV